MNQPFYIVATPIGNRDDITSRAIQILGGVDFIVAEDTRHTGQLISFYGIKKPFISFRDAPPRVMEHALADIKERIVKGESGAYVTDAGTPGISDPGWRLVQTLEALGVMISPIPGPSAVTALLSVAHVPIREYRFVGFLPKKKGHRSQLQDLIGYLQAGEERAVVFYESPNRIRKTLTDFMQLDGKLSATLGRELTKKFETIYRGPLSPELITQLPEKGEYTVLLYLKK